MKTVILIILAITVFLVRNTFAQNNYLFHAGGTCAPNVSISNTLAFPSQDICNIGNYPGLDENYTYQLNSGLLEEVTYNVLQTSCPTLITNRTFVLETNEMCFSPYFDKGITTDIQITWYPNCVLSGKTSDNKSLNGTPISVDENTTISLTLTTEYTGKINWYAKESNGTTYLLDNTVFKGKHISFDYDSLITLGNKSLKNRYGVRLYFYAVLIDDLYQVTSCTQETPVIGPIYFRSDILVFDNEGQTAGSNICDDQFFIFLPWNSTSPYTKIVLLASKFLDFKSFETIPTTQITGKDYVQVSNIFLKGFKAGEQIYFKARRENSDIDLTKLSIPINFLDPPKVAIDPKPSCQGYSNGILKVTLINPIPGWTANFNATDKGIVSLSPANPSYTFSNYSPGEKTYVVSYEIGKDKGAQCKTNDTFRIETMPLPSTPVITIDQYPSCTKDEVVLKLTSSTTNPNTSIVEYKLYKYMVEISSPTGIFTGLKADTYWGMAIDGMGCQSVYSPKTVVPKYTSIDLGQESLTHPSCFGEDNGQIKLKVMSGGQVNSAWQYSDDSTNWTPNPIFTGYEAGNASFYVRDTKYPQCYKKFETSFTEPPKIELELYPLTQVNSSFNVRCFNEQNGQIKATVKNATAPIEYIINGPSQGSVNGNLISDLAKGNYSVQIIDDKGCSSDVIAVTLTQPSEISTIYNSTPESCLGSGDGKISIQGVSDLPPCSYEWQDKYSLPVRENLKQGNYIIKVIDKIGCNKEFEIKVDTLPRISFSYLPSVPVCRGKNNGSLSLFNFKHNTDSTIWFSLKELSDTVSTSDTSVLLKNKYAGKYQLMLFDKRYIKSNNLNCITRAEVTIPEKQSINLSTSVTHAPCYADSGSIHIDNITGPGIINNYSYRWINNQGNPLSVNKNLEKVPAGIYDLEIKDNEGCDSLFTKFLIKEPPKLEFSKIEITPSNCHKSDDGTISIEAKGGSKTDDYDFSVGTGFLHSVHNFVNQADGDHLVSVRDDHNCQTDSTIHVSAGELKFEIIDTKKANCAEVGDGSVKMNAFGTRATNFTYHVGEMASSDKLIDSLFSGNYKAWVIDEFKCSTDTVPIEIGARELKISLISVDSANCREIADGEITFSAGGTNTTQIQYAVSDSFKNNNNFGNLSTGYYNLKALDDNGCMAHLDSVFVGARKVIINNITVTDASCKEVDDASLSVSAYGTQSANYNCSVDGKYWEKDGLHNLSDGIYKLTVSDDNKCIAEKTELTIGAGKVMLTLKDTSKTNCYGESNGSIEVSAIGGKGLYRYYVTGTEISDSNNSGVFNGLSANIYNLQAIDKTTGCQSDPLLQAVEQPDSLIVELVLIDSASCSQPTGKIDYSITGGNGGYDLLWYNPESGISNNLETHKLITGDYVLLVNDSKSCMENDTIHIPDRKPPMIEGFEILKQTWCDLPLGAVKVNTSGGAPAYTYKWNNKSHDTDIIADSLIEGTYHVTVTDRYNCSDDSTFTLIDGPEITLNTTVQEAHCGQKDAQVELLPDGGMAPYRYLWPDSVSENYIYDPVMTDLFSGYYLVHVFDTIGCMKTFTVKVNDLNGPKIENLTFTKAWCNLPRGTAKVAISGGFEPYRYEWSIAGDGNVIGNESQIKDLYSNEYILKVTDKEGCKVVCNIIVRDSTELEPKLKFLSLDSSSCNKPIGALHVSTSNGLSPYSYQWSNSDTAVSALHLKQGTYQVTATDVRGCRDSLTLQMIDRKLPKIFLQSTENTYCGKANGSASITAINGRSPYYACLLSDTIAKKMLSYSSLLKRYSARFDSLWSSQNPYIIKLTDNDGCESNEMSALITDLDPMTITLEEISPVVCFGESNGKAIIRVSNGVEPYKYAWSNNLSNTKINSSLPAGPFSVTATDATGCKKVYDDSSTPIAQPESIDVQSYATIDPTCHNSCNGSINAFANGGNGGYIYIWNNSDTSQTAENLCAANHQLTIYDKFGCRHDTIFLLSNPPELTQTDLPNETGICTGGTYSADPGSQWSNVIWSADNGFSSTTRVAAISIPGKYFMAGYSPKGCIVHDTLLLTNFINSNTGLPETVSVCIGQKYTADPGSEWSGVSWSSNNGFSANNRRVVISDSGQYYLTGYSKKGCIVHDTLILTSPPILSKTSLPEVAVICPENTFTADPGAGWNNISWTSDKGYIGNGHNVNLDGPAIYYLNAYNPKGCLARDTLIIINYSTVNISTLPSEAAICSGQVYKANPGNMVHDINWSSDNGYSYTGQVADITNEGTYYMKGYSGKGCMVNDTLTLLVSANLLDADFLMMSEASVGDTIVIIEVSWPIPDKVSWKLPEETTVKKESDAIKEIVFNTPGTYYVELTANLATCTSVKGKYIEILENEPDKSAEDISNGSEAFILNFNVFPNPVRDNLNMKVELAKETDIRVEIISISGSKLSDAAQGYNLSEYELSIDVSSLDPGMYLIRLIAGNQVKTKTMIVR